MLIMAGTTLFFTLLFHFLQNPFELTRIIPNDGSGLNPLLSKPWYGYFTHLPCMLVMLALQLLLHTLLVQSCQEISLQLGLKC